MKKEEEAKKEKKVSSRSTSVKKSSKKTSYESNNNILSTYKEFKTVGKIEIPKTGVNIPILSKVTAEGMEVAPCLLYSTGKLNYSGKTLIPGHNLSNGKIFSNNNKLKVGDKIYISTLDGKRVEYIIYKKMIMNSADVSYLEEGETKNPEIILSSCTDDENNRVVIQARANI